MKLTRLLGYAAMGMIIGLLIENKALTVKKNSLEKKKKSREEAEKDHHELDAC